MGFLDNTYLGDLANETLQNLGLSTGADAAKTIGNVVKEAKNSSAPVSGAAAAGSNVSLPAIPDRIFGLEKKSALLMAGAAVVTFFLIRRMKK